MSREMAEVLSRYADRASWLIQELLVYLEKKELLDEFSVWLAKRNKKRG